jgi:hypothetical protein
MITVHYRRWCPPKSPLRIEFRGELLHDVRREAVRPDPSAISRWKERLHPEINQSCGVLFGARHADEVRLLAARGEGEGADAGDLTPLGIFVCRARGEVFLTDDDLTRFEAQQGVVALVVAGTRAGFFVRERDGSIQAIRSHEEFAVADAARPLGSGAASPSKPTPASEKPSPAPGIWMAWKRMAACAALLAVPAGAFAYLHPLLHLPIALALREESGQLVIGWNAAALMDGSRLEIRDGSERTIVMLPAHTASATYGPQGNDVEVRLTTDTRTGGAHWEAARFITRELGRSSTALAAGAVQGRIAELKGEAQALRRSLVERQTRTGELLARMEAMTATPER